MATDAVRPAAVTATEHCLGLVERLRLTLEMTERFNKQLNDARDAIEQAKRLPAIAGRRNGKWVESSVRRNLNVASQACAGWRNSFDNAADNLVAWIQEFDAVVSSMSTGDRRQVAAVLSRKQPPALAILGFSPYYWEAEVSRELTEHVVGAMRRFFDCDDNARLFPLGDDFYDIETAVDIRDMLIRDLFDTLGTKSELDLLESELARDLAELRLIVDDRGAASIGIEITPVLRDLERVSESEPAEAAGQVAGGVPDGSPEQPARGAKPTKQPVARSPSGRVKLFGPGLDVEVDGKTCSIKADEYTLVKKLCELTQSAAGGCEMADLKNVGGATRFRRMKSRSPWDSVLISAGERGGRYRIL